MIIRNQPSNPIEFLRIGSDVYFTTTTDDYSTSTTSLWKTNGTESGTTKLITLAQIAYLREYNGQLIFSGNEVSDQAYYWDIFKSNGTPEGTVPTGLAFSGNYPPSTLPTDLTVIGTKIFYTTYNNGLWVTSGGPPTKLTTYPYARIQAAAGKQLFFVGTDSTYGAELWRSRQRA